MFILSKILVVDDYKNINKLIKSLLENEKYEVITAFDGEDALEKLDNEKVDMLITDVMMPNMDGRELCREVRLFSFCMNHKRCVILKMSKVIINFSIILLFGIILLKNILRE